MSELRAGMPVPDFELPDQAGKPVKLSSFHGASPVVLFFYPKDHTWVCTREARAFRDDYAQFRAIGAQLFGISDDSAESHCKFAGKNKLPYRLLSDKGGRVRKLFGVRKTLGVLPGRATFVIDQQGILLHVFSSQFEADAHVKEALQALKATLPSLR
jgi:peroxiredoxin Q/BCP